MTHIEDTFIQSNYQQMSLRQMARHLGKTHDQVRSRMKTLKLKRALPGDASPVGLTETGKKTQDEITGDKRHIVDIDTRIKTVDDLIKARKVDLDEWQVVRSTVGQHEGFYRDSRKMDNSGGWTGTHEVVQLYAVKIWLERRTIEAKASDKLRDDIIADIERATPLHRSGKVLKHGKEEILAELSCPDLHIGKLCCDEETGEGNYDLKIAESVYLAAMTDLLGKVKRHGVDRILIPVGNDLLHTDNKRNTTTAGTAVDTDGRWYKAFRVAYASVIRAVLDCSTIAPVDVIIVPGNHDQERTFYLGEVIGAYFKKDKNVRVNTSLHELKTYEWGSTLLGYHHGDAINHAALPMLLSHYSPQAFAKAKHKEIHLGHLHTRRHSVSRARHIKPELNMDVRDGVHVRIIPSLCTSDAWHCDNGYVGSPRAAEAYLYSKKSGLMAMFCHTPERA